MLRQMACASGAIDQVIGRVPGTERGQLQGTAPGILARAIEPKFQTLPDGQSVVAPRLGSAQENRQEKPASNQPPRSSLHIRLTASLREIWRVWIGAR